MSHHLLVNRVFPYFGWSNGPACCGLRIYRDRSGDRPDLVIVSELPENPGESVRHAGGRLLDFVAIHYGLDPDCLAWVEHLPAKPAKWGPGNPELFWQVEFAARPADGSPMPVAKRCEKTRAWVESMVGARLGQLVVA